MRQQPLFAPIINYNHVPITRLASASLAAATLHVRFPSFFSVISCPRASESSALLMEISITSAGAESSSISNFPSISSSQALSSHENKKSVERVIASPHIHECMHAYKHIIHTHKCNCIHAYIGLQLPSQGFVLIRGGFCLEGFLGM